jgi:hypothetical protein
LVKHVSRGGCFAFPCAQFPGENSEPPVMATDQIPFLKINKQIKKMGAACGLWRLGYTICSQTSSIFSSSSYFSPTHPGGAINYLKRILKAIGFFFFF